MGDGTRRLSAATSHAATEFPAGASSLSSGQAAGMAYVPGASDLAPGICPSIATGAANAADIST